MATIIPFPGSGDDSKREGASRSPLLHGKDSGLSDDQIRTLADGRREERSVIFSLPGLQPSNRAGRETLAVIGTRMLSIATTLRQDVAAGAQKAPMAKLHGTVNCVLAEYALQRSAQLIKGVGRIIERVRNQKGEQLIRFVEPFRYIEKPVGVDT